MLTQYTGSVEIEANCLVDMIVQQIIPAVKDSNVGELTEAVVVLKAKLAEIHHTSDEKTKAQLARSLRLETMIRFFFVRIFLFRYLVLLYSVREVCDAAEEVVPSYAWPLATYKELLFLDQQIGSN
jgi:glutamine synthetase